MRFAGFLLCLAGAGCLASMATSVWRWVRDDIQKKEWGEVGADLLLLIAMLATGAFFGTLGLVALGVME